MEKTTSVEIFKVNSGGSQKKHDHLVVEEPLEIRLGFRRGGVLFQKNISVTMRTPGHDEELALGFLFTEGILQHFSEVEKISRPPVRHREAEGNALTLELAEGVEFDMKKLERHFYTTSSCGVCGKTSIEAVEVKGCFDLPEAEPKIKGALLHFLPKKLREHQSVFQHTGGLHAAALFDVSGKLLSVREDVGRHNALDKLIGSALKNGGLPFSGKIILVSGRAGFELVQKSVVAGAPILAAVGAPSSLAVRLAEESGMTLVGFLRGGQFNVYSHPERILL